MKKYWILLLISFMALFSCTEDTSAYLPQDKEHIGIDSVKIDGDGGEQAPEEGVLTPGIHLVKLNIAQPDGKTVERRFKYFMPISVNQTKPISLIFEFHGSYEYDAKVDAPDPINGITNGHALIQHAIKENCIIVFPAGESVISGEKGYVNWQNSENHLPFVDKIVEFFKNSSPTIDINRIYSTGQSSGAIFSFVLAFERSTVFAAITPRAGQMSLANETRTPERAVAVRVFAGENDKTVIHSAVLKNMTAWAEKIGGYFAGDMVMSEEPFQIESYKLVDTRKWSGGNADLEIYTLKEEEHGISLSYCLPYMWEFMKSHPLNLAPVSCFIYAETKSIDASCSQKMGIPFNYTDGATISLEDVPADWQPVIDGKTLKLTAPADFYAPGISRDGEFTIKAVKDGKTASVTITYKLIAPKTYFDVGDIYYNADFEAVGVVCWVDPNDIREAKIVSLETPGGGTIFYNNNDPKSYLGATFATPDKKDGAGNTQKMIDRNATLELPSTAANSAFVWAHEYSYKGIGGWYLPAIEEYQDFAKKITLINDILVSLNAKKIELIVYSSTVELGTNNKVYYYYDFAKSTIASKTSANEYLGYITPRAMKKVSK